MRKEDILIKTLTDLADKHHIKILTYYVNDRIVFNFYKGVEGCGFQFTKLEVEHIPSRFLIDRVTFGLEHEYNLINSKEE